MAYLGIGYTGNNASFLRDMVNENMAWLKGDRLPRFFGERFVILYDSNTAREFAKKCKDASEDKALSVFPVGRPYGSM